MYNNRWKLYECISKNRYLTDKELANIMNWSERKIKRLLKKLIKDKMIVREKDRYRSKTIKEFINWDEFNK